MGWLKTFGQSFFFNIISYLPYNSESLLTRHENVFETRMIRHQNVVTITTKGVDSDQNFGDV